MAAEGQFGPDAGLEAGMAMMEAVRHFDNSNNSFLDLTVSTAVCTTRHYYPWQNRFTMQLCMFSH